MTLCSAWDWGTDMRDNKRGTIEDRATDVLVAPRQTRSEHRFEAWLGGSGEWYVSRNGWGIGYSFARESAARDAADTLNKLIELDEGWRRYGA